MNLFKRKKNLFLKVILLILFLVDYLFMRSGMIESFDNYIYNLFNINENITGIFNFITFFGSMSCLIVLTLFLVFYFKDNKKVAVSIPLNLTIIAILNFLIKCIVQRPRPDGINLIEESGFSFPSGHSASSFAFYGLLIYIIFCNSRKKSIRLFGIACLSILILLIGISRIYLGVHYASDVLGGFLLAGFYLIYFIELFFKSKNSSMLDSI